MLKLSSKVYRINATTVNDAITQYDSHTRKDIKLKKWEMSIRMDELKTGLALRGHDVYEIKPRGIETLLQRVDIPMRYARKIPNNLIAYSINNLLDYDKDKDCIVRLVDGDVSAVLSGSYGITNDKVILEAVKERENNIEVFNYVADDSRSLLSLNPIGSVDIPLDENYSARCDSSIENSDTAESSLRMFTSVYIIHKDEETGVYIHLRNSTAVMHRLVHRGNITARFKTSLDEFLESAHMRHSLIANKIESLVSDESEEIAENVWNSIIHTLEEKGSIELKDKFVNMYPFVSRSNLETFLRVARFKSQPGHNDLNADLLDKIAESLLW